MFGKTQNHLSVLEALSMRVYVKRSTTTFLLSFYLFVSSLYSLYSPFSQRWLATPATPWATPSHFPLPVIMLMSFGHLSLVQTYLLWWLHCTFNCRHYVLVVSSVIVGFQVGRQIVWLEFWVAECDKDQHRLVGTTFVLAGTSFWEDVLRSNIKQTQLNLAT